LILRRNTFIVATFLVISSTLVKTQNEKVLACGFWFNSLNDYECMIENLEIEIHQNQTIRLVGNHLGNYTNLDVVTFTITRSNIPFIIKEVFTTFPNLRNFNVANTGLRWIQWDAFRNCDTLTRITMRDNPQLSLIEPLAFAGASNVQRMIINNASLSDLHDNTFVGMSQLQYLSMERNRITKFSPRTLRPLLRLEELHLWFNLFEVLTPEMFRYNNRLTDLTFADNRINAIDRNFLQPTPLMTILMLQDNACIHFNIIFGIHSEATIQRVLEPCFQNFDRIEGV
jgi:hypothetical protein